MELKNHWLAANKIALPRLLQWVNLRPEESERTQIIFVFYTTVSVGLRWAEDSTVALFLDEYGTNLLPWMYIASAAMSAGLVFLYSWLQKIFPLRRVIVAIAPCMLMPLVLLVVLRWGSQFSYLAVISVFLLRLWVDALYVVNDLNISIVANQLFNIREIKRTYPLVSSGLLVADVISGFSLPWLVQYATLNKIILIACVVILLGSGILLYLTHHYRAAFPETPQRLIPEEQASRERFIKSPLKRYVWQLFAFVGLLQVIGLLIDFQYLRELKSNMSDRELASFLGLFGGTLGLCELLLQWFISSRLIERMGVFFTATLLPITVGFSLPGVLIFLHLIPAIQSQSFFWGLIIVKFCDELLRYTFVMSSGPILYQPIPEAIRSRMQTLSGGTAEAIATGLTGALIFATLMFCGHFVPTPMQKWVLVAETMLITGTCLTVVWELRSRYVELLVLSVARGHLSATNVGLRFFKQGVVKALAEKGSEADKRSCIELLAQIDSQGAAEVLDHILRSLLKIHKQPGITGLVDRFYKSRVENLIEQELKFLGEIYAAYTDFQTLEKKENHQSSERISIVSELLQRALLELELDVKERLLLLLRLLYSPEKIQAAAFNLRSLSVVNLARGLEILEHTVTLSSKSLLLNILDNRPQLEKLQHLVEAKIVEYENMIVSDRLHRLLTLGNFLSDWCLACCFHFAQVTRIRLTSSEILVSLRHPTGFVREAAIAYLNMVSHRVLLQILPQLQKDPHPLVAAQVKELLEKYQFNHYE
ncbi:MAG: hypothetical protein KME55_18095 [Nostoc indistinguendum CM1-VF10]|jgi:hypothetical protein|nr:hypothetical protein [Nostoc indistinguendum CM1-VF10]